MAGLSAIAAHGGYSKGEYADEQTHAQTMRLNLRAENAYVEHGRIAMLDTRRFQTFY
jgi:hypothetical protein